MEILDLLTDVAQGITKLKSKYVAEDLKIDYITIFAQTSREYKKLVGKARDLGKAVDAHNGLIFRLNEPFEFGNSRVEYFRIRRPDTHRPQKGCGDFQVEDYEEFKKKYMTKYPKNMKEEDKNDFMMVELAEEKGDYLVYFPDSPLAY